MPEIYRDYSKNVVLQLEGLEEKVQCVREHLSPELRSHFDRVISTWRQGGPPPEEQLAGAVTWIPDYWVKPVSIRQFISEPQFLGQALGDQIYPRIVDDLEELFDGDYEEVVLGGSQRWGKSKFAEVGIAYEIYRVSCLRDPGRSLGALPGTKLAFVNASLTRAQARRVIFEGLLSLLKQSFYFQHWFPFDSRITTEIRFTRGDVICYPVAAHEQAFMGIDIFSAAIDEANFMQVVEKSKRTVSGQGDRYDQVETIYNRLLARLRLSWNKKDGGMPGHAWLISSARYPGDFTERKELEAKENPKIFVRRYAIWDTKPGMKDLPKFYLEVGDVTRRSRVLPDAKEDWPANVNPARVITPPQLLKYDFMRNPERCVRDMAGISILSVTPFIQNRQAIRRMFELGEAAGMKPPFSALEVTLQNPASEAERLLPENLHRIERQKRDNLGRPLFKDRMGTIPFLETALFSALYYAHIDLSKTTDATGIVVAHAVGAKKVQRYDDQSGQIVYESMPIIRVDLALRVVAPQNGEIDIPKVRSLIYQLRNVGMEFGLVTFDTYGSQESVKALKDAGYPADVYSVDNDFTPWEEMKQALYDERLMCYEFPHLEQELAQLERTPKKIDHPVRGSKDIADCLAAVVHHVEEGWRKGMGSQGMFQIGILEGQGASQLAEDDLFRQAVSKVVRGGPLTPAEENRVVFRELEKL